MIKILIFIIINIPIYYVYLSNNTIVNKIKSKLKYLNSELLNNKIKNYIKVYVAIMIITTIILTYYNFLYGFIYYIIINYTIYKIIEIIINIYKNKIISENIIFYDNLKNNINLYGDVVKAFSNINQELKIYKYFKDMKVKIESGMSFENVLDEINKQLDIKEYNEFFLLIKNSYKYGANLSIVMEKEKNNYINKLNIIKDFKKKEKELDMVISIFIILNIVLLIKNESDFENLKILKNIIYAGNIIYLYYIIIKKAQSYK